MAHPAKMQQVSWIPNNQGDFMQGENRLDGKVITVSGWQRRSHVMKLKMLREFALKYGGDPHMRWFECAGSS